MTGAPLHVLYDRECRWCRFSVAQILRFDPRGEILPVAIQSPEGQELLAPVDPGERLLTAHAVGDDGVVHSGGDAVAVIAARLPALTLATPALRRMGLVSRAGYGLVAGNRHRLGPLVSPARLARADAAIARHRREHFGLDAPQAPEVTSCAVPRRAAA
jgi:predicted DCC family thiol-disulfide oxidoreductase YuxK